MLYEINPAPVWMRGFCLRVRKTDTFILHVLNQLIEHSVLTAVPDEPAMGDPRNTRLQIPFRILFSHNQRVTGKQCDKSDVVILCHFVAAGYEVLVVDKLHIEIIAVFSFFWYYGF